MTQSYTNYAFFNSVTFQGRVFAAKRCTGQYGDFVAVTLITTLTTDGQELTVTFNDQNGILSMFDADKLPIGRIITVTGHIESVRETWDDEKAGETKLLDRPKIHLKQAAIFDGGYGMMPKSKAPVSRKGVKVVRPSDAKEEEAAPVDEAPVITETAQEPF